MNKEHRWWKYNRDQSKARLGSIKNQIRIIRENGTLLKAETDICDIIEANVDSLLGYFDERSVVSCQRFVKEVSLNEKS